MMKQSNPASVRGRLWLVALAAMLALTGMAASVTQTKTSADSIENFGKVNENYYRGSQPHAEGFVRLKKLGVKTVIDLRKDSVREEPEWVRAAGMQYFNIPLKADRAATEEQTAYFLKLVSDPNNWPVFVHCKGGRHRTGALTGIYRITHDGWTADQAYKEMKEYDFEHGFFGGPSAQKNYVYSFYERRVAGSGQR
jgi:protein tyrosine/serine phosphatase